MIEYLEAKPLVLRADAGAHPCDVRGRTFQIVTAEGTALSMSRESAKRLAEAINSVVLSEDDRPAVILI